MENKIATLKEIASRLNFSVSTVSRALHNHPSIGLRTTAQVHKLAKELNYEPNQTALLFKQQKTNTIGVILPNLNEEFFSQAINGIEDVARQNNYSVLIGQSHDEVEQEKQIINAMKNQRVDGLIEFSQHGHRGMNHGSTSDLVVRHFGTQQNRRRAERACRENHAARANGHQFSGAKAETVGVRENRRTGDSTPHHDFDAADVPGAVVEQYAAHLGIRQQAEWILHIHERFENQLC